MMIVVQKSIPDAVYEEIRSYYPDFRVWWDYGQPGKTYYYAVLDISDREFLLFKIRWGEYFAV